MTKSLNQEILKSAPLAAPFFFIRHLLFIRHWIFVIGAFEGQSTFANRLW
jgi:hypothetical protein